MPVLNYLLLQGLHLTRYISFLQLSYKFKTLYVLGMKMIRFLTAIVLITCISILPKPIFGAEYSAQTIRFRPKPNIRRKALSVDH